MAAIERSLVGGEAEEVTEAQEVETQNRKMEKRPSSDGQVGHLHS